MFDHFNHPPQVQSEPPPPKKVLRFDRGYAKSLPGILKLSQLVRGYQHKQIDFY